MHASDRNSDSQYYHLPSPLYRLYTQSRDNIAVLFLSGLRFQTKSRNFINKTETETARENKANIYAIITWVSKTARELHYRQSCK